MVNILVVTSYYSFLKCYHHGNWYTSNFSVLVLKTYSEFTMMSGRLSKWTNKQTTRSQIQLEHFALGSVSSKPGLWTKSSLRLKALRTMGAGGPQSRGQVWPAKLKKIYYLTLSNVRHSCPTGLTVSPACGTADMLCFGCLHLEPGLHGQLVIQEIIANKSEMCAHIQRNGIQSQKVMPFRHMLRHGRILKALR